MKGVITMAKKFNIGDYVGITEAGVDILNNSRLFVTDVRPRKKYVDNKVTDEIIGSNVTIEFDRHQSFVGDFVIATDEVISDDFIDKDVVVNIIDAKVYSRTSKGSNYSTVEVSLHGTVALANDIGE
ncbi:hypothetical protein FC64_GL000097 [Ligilactobacillus araffinosus DSM 20653]|uniref:Uncharacterized protein n=2 Tax=Ligilactobacillus araffinosus TaxID=147809 RepID=A0A0R1ZFN2_9LACO|nr:hypothetical protein FC64_GL000097 [Ligilactobacillus araffinosus DSM 20653]